MACFYEMNELGIPLEQVQLDGTMADKIGVKKLKFGKIEYDSPEFGEPENCGKRQFYTMRVCKDCRADWMEAIKNWYDEKETPSKINTTGTGVFVRKLGKIYELTEEEVKERWIY
jgi:hypothetical protein